jgi:hypothetical protein
MGRAMSLVPRRTVRRSAAAAALSAVAVVLGLAAGTATPVLAGTIAHRPAAAISSGDEPAGFWYGTDSSNIAVPGRAKFGEPVIGGGYSGYLGMIGNWANWQGCGGRVVWSAADSAHARANYLADHAGIGVGGYWFMAGPGVDPRYSGTTKEAAAWGVAQAKQALADLHHTPTPVNYPVIFMDIELPGYAPAIPRRLTTGGAPFTPRPAVAR